MSCLDVFKSIVKTKLSFVKGTSPFDWRVADFRVIADNCSPENATYYPIEQSLGTTATNLLISETKYGYYVKPTEPYYKYEFEKFFGFGRGNAGFYKQRVIFVPK
uniref:Uncharacterized protein n=1 Tax=viral metagenome TaxID=1070528 RepID=A0A6C0J434_9ZZZZ